MVWKQRLFACCGKRECPCISGAANWGNVMKTNKMAQWVKALAAKLDVLNSVPGTNMAEGGSLHPQTVIWSLPTDHGMHVCVYTLIINALKRIWWAARGWYSTLTSDLQKCTCRKNICNKMQHTHRERKKKRLIGSYQWSKNSTLKKYRSQAWGHVCSLSTGKSKTGRECKTASLVHRENPRQDCRAKKNQTKQEIHT